MQKSRHRLAGNELVLAVEGLKGSGQHICKRREHAPPLARVGQGTAPDKSRLAVDEELVRRGQVLKREFGEGIELEASILLEVLGLEDALRLGRLRQHRGDVQEVRRLQEDLPLGGTLADVFQHAQEIVRRS